MKGWIEIFRAGKQTDMSGHTEEFTTKELDEIVETYDAKTHEAPVVIGHPKTDDPAWGWAEELRRDGDVLMAKLKDVSPAFDEAVKKGRYKKRSVSLYSPDNPVNPHPGKFALKHIGFLGGAAPAVKGLADPAFSERKLSAEFAGQDAQTFEFSDDEGWKFRTAGRLFRALKDYLIEKEGVEAADKMIGNWEIEELMREPEKTLPYSEDKVKEDTSMNEKELAEKLAAADKENADLKAKYAESQTANAEKDKKISEYAESEKKAIADAKRAKITGAAEKMIVGGRLDAKEKDKFVSFAMTLDESETLAFSEGKKSGLDYFLGFAETAKPGVAPDGKAKYGKDRAPEGNAAGIYSEGVDPDKADIHEKVKQYQESRPGMSYTDALSNVLM
jgi:hypothetical protein